MWLNYALLIVVVYLLLLRRRDAAIPPSALRELLERPLAEFRQAARGIEASRGEADEFGGWGRALQDLMPKVRDKKLRDLLFQFYRLHSPTGSFQGYPSTPIAWDKSKDDWERLASTVHRAQQRIDELQFRSWGSPFKL